MGISARGFRIMENDSKILKHLNELCRDPDFNASGPRIGQVGPQLGVALFRFLLPFLRLSS
jgi:hypothetical protein